MICKILANVSANTYAESKKHKLASALIISCNFSISLVLQIT